MANSKALAVFKAFRTELDGRADKLAPLLPKHIPHDRFVHFALTAVARMPALLSCNRLSLHRAIEKAAVDELLPDGREGVIIPRFENGTNVACWQPMVHGIRKRAAEEGIIIDAKVIRAKDHMVWEEGLTPVLRVQPAPLDQDPGEMIGAFAIFRRNSQVLHHEVMRRSEIEAVRSVSKQKDGLLWTKFTDQAWVKTVVRRAAKSVPAVPRKLQDIIERSDDDFSFDRFNKGADAAVIDQTPRDPLADAEGTPPVDDINQDPEPTEADFSGLEDAVFDDPDNPRAGNVRPISRRRQA